MSSATPSPVWNVSNDHARDACETQTDLMRQTLDSTQCFCDNVIRQSGEVATDDSQCNMECSGNPDEKCGGPNRLSVWSSQDPVKVVKKPEPTETVDGGWKYQGCLVDPQGAARVFPWQLVNTTGNSPEWCLGQCKKFGYMAAGLEYGDEW